MIDHARVWCARSRDNLLRQLQVFTGDSYPLRLLIFPEGTTVNQRSMDKCLEFAKKVMMAPRMYRPRFPPHPHPPPPTPGMRMPRAREHPLRCLDWR